MEHVAEIGFLHWS